MHPSRYLRSAGMLKECSCRSTWIFFLVGGPLRRVGVCRSTPRVSHRIVCQEIRHWLQLCWREPLLKDGRCLRFDSAVNVIQQSANDWVWIQVKELIPAVLVLAGRSALVVSSWPLFAWFRTWRMEVSLDLCWRILKGRKLDYLQGILVNQYFVFEF